MLLASGQLQKAQLRAMPHHMHEQYIQQPSSCLTLSAQHEALAVLSMHMKTGFLHCSLGRIGLLRCVYIICVEKGRTPSYSMLRL